MAVTARQPNEPPPKTYWDMLHGSEDTLVPFNKESTAWEIKEKLKELHSATSDKHRTSEKIETLLKNRKERLQKIIAHIDIEYSPRSFNWEFISELKVDFSLHIDAVIDTMPALDKYIGEGEYVKQSFSKAGNALGYALDALEALGELKDTDTEEKINEKGKVYTALHTATNYFEEGLSKWDIQPAPFEKNLEEYLKDSTARLKEQLEAIENTRFSLKFENTSLPPAEKELETYENLLRAQVLKTLLAIPEQTLPNDNKSQELINASGIHTYIFDKSNVIKELRAAKIALNLALDRYKLITPPARMKRGNLNPHIDSCNESLKTILDTLR